MKQDDNLLYRVVRAGSALWMPDVNEKAIGTILYRPFGQYFLLSHSRRLDLTPTGDSDDDRLHEYLDDAADLSKIVWHHSMPTYLGRLGVRRSGNVRSRENDGMPKSDEPLMEVRVAGHVLGLCPVLRPKYALLALICGAWSQHLPVRMARSSWRDN